MKVPIFCSLLPVDLFISLGLTPVYLTPRDFSENGSSNYHCVLHENVCSYSKVLYDFFLKRESEFDVIVVPMACDAMKKLYNALLRDLGEGRVQYFDMPKIKDGSAARFLERELERIKKIVQERLRTTRSPVIAEDHPLSSPWKRGSSNFDESGFLRLRRTGMTKKTVATIGILGSNVNTRVFEKVSERFGFGLDYINHCLYKAAPDPELVRILEGSDPKCYAEKFLEKNRCPRTVNESYKKSIIEEIHSKRLSGVVVNVLKFCDFQPFDYLYLKEKINIPILMIEHELTSDYEGQVMTRLEAFFELIQKKAWGRQKTHTKGEYFVGIDSGSHATKLVCVNSDEQVVARHVTETGTSVQKSVDTLLKELEEKSGINKGKIMRVVATGYGRNNVKGADDVVTEITCHALGVYQQLKKAATIIDIGGQDSKAIKIDENGSVVRFAMNDKCAAGTGRFLEVMAAKLQMSLAEFAELARSAENHVPISSMCSVFAESEVISLIASGGSKNEIAKGIHRAIAERTSALAKRIDSSPPYYMAGGVAKNIGLVKELSISLGSELTVINDPQFSGALGAALIAARGRDGISAKNS